MIDYRDSDPSLLTPRQVFVILISTLFLVMFVGTAVVLIGGRSLALLSEALIIVPSLVFVWRFKVPFLRVFRLNRINGPIFIYTIIISLAVFVISDALDRFVGNLFPMPVEWLEAMKALVRIDTPLQALLLFVSAVLIAGFAEEMLFRGMLQRTLEIYREPAIAIVLSSVFFAVAHFNPWTALQITFLGLALGYLTWKSDSILPGVFLHATNNLLSIVLMNTSETRLAWYGTEKQVNMIWLFLALALIAPVFTLFNRACEEKMAADRHKETLLGDHHEE